MKTKKEIQQENPSLRALKIIAQLKYQIQTAELQLNTIDKLLPGYERVPQNAFSALRSYRAHLDYLEQLILLPDHATAPDIIA